MADVIAKRSLCTRAQVGAVIIDGSNRIVATGYNGPPAGFHHEELPCSEWCPRSCKLTGFDPGYNDCISLHAEANAISVCDRSSREGGTLYVNGHVCFNCAKLIANSGIQQVVVLASLADPAVHRNPTRSYEFLNICGIRTHTIYKEEGADC